MLTLQREALTPQRKAFSHLFYGKFKNLIQEAYGTGKRKRKSSAWWF